MKIPLRGSIQEFNVRQCSNELKDQDSPRKATSGQVNETSLFSAIKDSPVDDASLLKNASFVSMEVEEANSCSEKCFVNVNDYEMGSSNLQASGMASLHHKSGTSHEKVDAPPKIKSGNLVEGILAVDYGNASGAGCKFREIDYSEDLAVGSGESLPCDGHETKNIVELTAYDESGPPSPHFLSLENITFEKYSEVQKEQIETEKVVCSVSVSTVENEETKHENGQTHEPSRRSAAVLEQSDDETAMESIDPFEEADCSDVPVVSHMDSASFVGESIPCTTNTTSECLESKNGRESTVYALKEGSVDTKLEPSLDDALEAKNQHNSIASEDKERFRERLWCFLFENLNRAVDELYLLCELECDLEQMKEVSLVLEEAASDFRELKSRVENFEKSKGASYLRADMTSLAMQPNHRRPHALSWEVRRMTTSPHRADILSSSLEIFRKIQQGRISEQAAGAHILGSDGYNCHFGEKGPSDLQSSSIKKEFVNDSGASKGKEKKQQRRYTSKEKRNESAKMHSVRSRTLQRESSSAYTNLKGNREVCGASSEAEKLQNKKNMMLAESIVQKNIKSDDSAKKNIQFAERERERKIAISTRSLDAWKEKRNWEDILNSPHRMSASFSYSPGMSRRSVERVRFLHDKLMTPEKKKKSALDLKREADEKHARATRIRTQLENERAQKLQRTSEKLNRVSEWQTVRSNKLRESMFARHRRGESRHEAYLAEVVRRAGDESSKVNEVRFITSLNEENKKHILQKKLQDSELRRAEKLQIIKIKQKEDMAREEAVLERRRLIEVEKLQRHAETQRRKEEAQVRREEERKASTAAREAKAMEQMRRKEIRARARQEEAELLAQKLAERLSESEQRRKFYLEQIREKASMDFRDQSLPFFRRFPVKDGQSPGKSAPLFCNKEDTHVNDNYASSGSCTLTSDALKHSLKRRIKKVRQRLMSLKYDFPEPPFNAESSSLGYRTAVGTARAKISRSLQDLQKLRQARKEGAANFGLITAEMIKFLEGKDAELQASRQSGLIDFIASTLPASHSSKPEACLVTVYLLRLLRIVLATQTNKCYFLVQNLLPPIIPMLAAALENYIRMAALLNTTAPSNSSTSKTMAENVETISEILNGFLWTVAAVVGLESSNGPQLQMQEALVELIIAYQIIHRLRELFALYDRPQAEGSPFPSVILHGINLLSVITAKFRSASSLDCDLFLGDAILGNHQESVKVLDSSVDDVDYSAGYLLTASPRVDKLNCCGALGNESIIGSGNLAEQNNAVNGGSSSDKTASFLLSAMSETGLACLPSMLTAVLLQAHNRSAEQVSLAPSSSSFNSQQYYRIDDMLLVSYFIGFMRLCVS
ncbi:hypothetical protein M569_04216 [Genlisea aurea]|uniref:S phase cyclin A-associated protein in the endoplasmic reticulum N-terminal domain-containing protein n=1 Tax=Genlisea aurea TaxID=192259 RepID=S8CTF0_9LAMI|nr:hypothetical protein M569_04216 [Genlisea aurea]